MTRARSRLHLSAGNFLLFVSVFATAAPGQTVINWAGGSGSWPTSANWTGGLAPGTGNAAQLSAGTASVDAPVTVANLLLAGGNVAGASTLTVTGSGSAWTGGSLVGTGTLAIASGATFAISGTGNRGFSRADGNGNNGRTIENSGTVVWTGSAQLLGGDGARILNLAGGLFDLQSDSTLGYSGSGSQATFANAGTFRKSAGTGTSTVSGTPFTNTGTVSVQTGTLAFATPVTGTAGTWTALSGSTLTFSGGQSFSAGSTFNGSGTTRFDAGTTTLNGAISVQNATFAGGILQGTSSLTGTLAWTGGSWSGTGTLGITSGSTLNLNGGGAKVLNRGDGNGSGGRILENFGQINWVAGDLNGGDGAAIVNRAGGLFRAEETGTLGFTGSGSLPTFLNEGTFTRGGIVLSGVTADPEPPSGFLEALADPDLNFFGYFASAAAKVTTVSGFVFTNTGNVGALDGILDFTSPVVSNGGTFTASSGAELNFSGAKTFNTGTSLSGSSNNIRLLAGATTVAGSLTMNQVEFAGGDLYGSASIGGNVTWTAGTWRGADTVAFLTGSTLTLDGAATKSLIRGDGNGSNGRILRSGGTVIWNGGGALAGADGAGIDILAGGTFEIRNDRTFAHNGAGQMPFLTNAGTVRKLASAGTTVFQSVQFTNTGRLELLGGTLSLAGSGGLANAGIVEIFAGTLENSASGMSALGGTYLVQAGGLLRFTGGTHTVASTAFNGAGLTEIAGGVLSVGSGTVGGRFRLGSGSVTGAGTFTVGSTGEFTWAGGSLTGTGTLAIAAGGQLLIEGAAAKTFFRGDGNGSNGRIVANAGNVVWSDAGGIAGGDGAAFNNLAGGVFAITGDAAFGYTGNGAAPTFANAGTLRKTAGTGTTALDLAVSNSGVLESKSGTLLLGGGGSGNGQFVADGGILAFGTSYTLTDGARFLGATFSKLLGGTLGIPGGSTAVVGGTGAGNFRLEGGTLGGGGIFEIGNLGNFVWAGGTMTSTGTTRIAAGGTFSVIEPVFHDFARSDGNGSNGRIIENFGTFTWSNGSLRGGDGAFFANRAGALFAITGSGSFSYTGNGAGPSFLNAGTIRKTGAGATTFSGTAFTSSGAVETQVGSLGFSSPVTSNGGTFATSSGANLAFSGGQTFNSGTTFTGGGQVDLAGGTTVLDGILNAAQLTLTGGTVAGSATLNGIIAWQGGTFSSTGTLTIATGSSLLLGGAGSRDFFRGDGNGSGGRIFDNFGLIRVQNDSAFRGGDGALIRNRPGAVLEFRNDATFGYTGNGSAPTLVNEGIFRKTASAGTTLVSSMNVTHTGTIEVQSGTLRFQSANLVSDAGQFSVASGASLEFAGTHAFNHGTAFSGPGAVRFGGSTTLSGALSLSANVELIGGDVFGTATLSSGVLKWSAGTLRGANTLTVGPAASLIVDGLGARFFVRGDGNGSGGRIIDNYGTMIVRNETDLLGNDGAQLINRPGATLTLLNSGAIAHGGGGAEPTFVNGGTFTKTDSPGTTSISIPFTNTGTIAVASGTLAITGPFTNTGSILLSGGTLQVAGTLSLGTSPLLGSGTISAASVVAGGTVAPGNSPGALNVTGDLTLLATSALLIELGGTVAGSGYDVLTAGGGAALAGSLSLSFVNGFAATVQNSDTFTVVTAGGSGLTGAFANIASGQRLFTTDGVGSFLVNYGSGSPFAASSVVLSNFQPIPEPSTYVLLACGALAVLWQFRRRR